MVRFGIENQPLTKFTPAVRVANHSAVIPVLGLLPDTRYVLQVVAIGEGGGVIGPAHALTTGPLPSDISVYVAGGTNPSPGYVAFSTGQYGVVLDNTGRLVWYYRFASNQVLNFQPQPTGKYVARPPPSDPLELRRLDRNQCAWQCDAHARLRRRSLAALARFDCADRWLVLDHVR